MLKFYDRKGELEALERIFKNSKSSARFTYITGKRRVGKTFLIEHFFRNVVKDKYFYLFVGRKTEYALCDEFSEVFRKDIDIFPKFNELEAMFEFLLQYSYKNNISVILDEFQNFEYVNKSFFSTLQKLWDRHKDKAKINLIVIGSLYSSMEKIFSSRHEPLYGRTTGKMHIKPFNISVINQMLKDNKVPGLNKLIDFYTIFNGVPKYYELISEERLFRVPISKVFARLFLNDDSLLKSEGVDLLIEEFGKDYQRYFSILEAIARETNITNQKISSYTGIKENELGSYLNNLENTFNIIKREVPIVGKENRKGKYKIKDSLTLIWFRFIFKNLSYIESGRKDIVLEKFKNDFNSLRGYHFENMVKEILFYNLDIFNYTEIGKFWDKKVEIDVIGINKDTKTAIVGECKLRLRNVDKEKLIEKTKYINEKYLQGYKIRKAVFTLDIADMTQNIKSTEDIDYYGKDEIENLVSIPSNTVSTSLQM